jgi:hypothetical protein
MVDRSRQRRSFGRCLAISDRTSVCVVTEGMASGRGKGRYQSARGRRFVAEGLIGQRDSVHQIYEAMYLVGLATQSREISKTPFCRLLLASAHLEMSRPSPHRDF